MSDEQCSQNAFWSDRNDLIFKADDWSFFGDKANIILISWPIKKCLLAIEQRNRSQSSNKYINMWKQNAKYVECTSTLNAETQQSCRCINSNCNYRPIKSINQTIVVALLSFFSSSFYVFHYYVFFDFHTDICVFSLSFDKSTSRMYWNAHSKKKKPKKKKSTQQPKHRRLSCAHGATSITCVQFFFIHWCYYEYVCRCFFLLLSLLLLLLRFFLFLFHSFLCVICGWFLSLFHYTID